MNCGLDFDHKDFYQFIWHYERHIKERKKENKSPNKGVDLLEGLSNIKDFQNKR